VFLAFLPASTQEPGILLREDCSDFATIIATLEPNAPVEVRSSVAGNEKTCYSVSVVIDGKPVNGYVQGNELRAVAEFERRRMAAAAAIVNVAPAEAEATAPSVPTEKPHYPPFGDFSGVDMKGRRVSVHGLKGKVNLVCFWSPRHSQSSRELLAVNALYGQFAKQGMDALAVSLSSERAALLDALDDYHLGFPNLPNGFNIAARYNIDYDTLPRTYVLNENFEVVASGLHGKALEDLVKKLAAGK
jgi:peroxiredoxin